MRNTKHLPPSERAAHREAEEKKVMADKQATEQKLRTAMGITFSTAEGKTVLRWLAEQCGHNRPMPIMNPVTGEIDDKRTVYNAFRLNLYLAIRKNLPFEILKEVEYEN